MAGCHVKPEQAFNLIFGYESQYFERVFDLNPGASTKFLYGTAVDPGEVWVITSMAAFNNTRDPATISVGVYDGATWMNATQQAGPGAGITISYQGQLPMKAGDKAFAYFTGGQAADDLYLDIIGYKMKLTQ